MAQRTRPEVDMSGTSNARIRTVDMRVLDKVFGMEDGYVLDFSNRTYAEFFRPRAISAALKSAIAATACS